MQTNRSKWSEQDIEKMSRIDSEYEDFFFHRLIIQILSRILKIAFRFDNPYFNSSECSRIALNFMIIFMDRLRWQNSIFHQQFSMPSPMIVRLFLDRQKIE